VLRVEPKKDDQAPSAILELVDGPRDMRFAMTAKTVARQREQGIETLNELTALNVRKVTRFRKNGIEVLEDAIKKISLGKKDKGDGKEDKSDRSSRSEKSGNK
jgi:large subunit ribosomal protein L17